MKGGRVNFFLLFSPSLKRRERKERIREGFDFTVFRQEHHDSAQAPYNVDVNLDSSHSSTATSLKLSRSL